jgi:glycerol-3-phosphate acyltransferase PlsY
LIFLFYCLSLILSYLLGSINTALLVSKFRGEDIRERGSKNAGTTNVLRSFGKTAAIIVFAGDILKAVVAVLLVRFFGNLLSASLPALHVDLCTYLAGLGVVLGHNFPLYFGFRGGKGVATSMAVILMIHPLFGVISLVIGVLIIAVTRYVSLGSMAGSLVFFLLALLFARSDLYFFLFAFVISGLVIFMHRANIRRLFAGEENKLGSKKKG